MSGAGEWVIAIVFAAVGLFGLGAAALGAWSLWAW